MALISYYANLFPTRSRTHTYTHTTRHDATPANTYPAAHKSHDVIDFSIM